MNLSREQEYGCALWFVGGLILFIIAAGIGAVWIDWYDAGIQAAVYKRQGVEMTQWEVWCGAKPIERVVGFKEGERVITIKKD